ncbi:MAG: hypothetical protein A2511_01565 [Deltaproteobacteria bacterium RIFOXYD12_FULL_50_9]|nr:MAG: hypothetical protein A2511_01565 [Deltaproteobacteria bacterium RIFOXYD12_FULL_50_9]
MKTTSILSVVLATALLGITVTPASAEDNYANYVMLKGGIYSPSNSYDLQNYNNGSRTSLDSETGFAGEVAAGRYFLPNFAIEMEAGYFASKGSAAAGSGDAKLQVVPLVATGKILIPIGQFEPYGLWGIGAYIAKLEVDGNTSSSGDSTEIVFGFHAGVGCSYNFKENMFAGLEVKYLWAEPSFDGQDVNLDGFITTANIGFRY